MHEDTPFVKLIREHEIECVLPLIPPRSALLEIGAGHGWQAHALAQKGFSVDAIDIDAPSGKTHWPVKIYDGQTLPFPDNSFDVIFSSNVLEHVKNLPALQDEMRRVLKKDGIAIHTLPTATWRFWNNATYRLCGSMYFHWDFLRFNQRLGSACWECIEDCLINQQKGEKENRLMRFLSNDHLLRIGYRDTSSSGLPI